MSADDPSTRVPSSASAGVPRRGRQTRGRLTWGVGLAVGAFRSTARVLWKEHYSGQEHIPRTGPALVVMNHISELDPLLFAGFVWRSGRTPRIMLKESLATAPVVGAVVKSAGQIPVKRGKSGAHESLLLAKQALEDGQVVCVYPEGTVTRDPAFWPMVAKTGAARLAAQSPDVPVIPVAQWGPQRSLDYHTGKRDLFPRKDVWITAGPPIDLGPDRARTDPAAVRASTLTMMRTIRDMLSVIRGEPAPDEFFNPTPGRTDRGEAP